jgi:hypothetical protein
MIQQEGQHGVDRIRLTAELVNPLMEFLILTKP